MEPVISVDYTLIREEPALVHPRSVALVGRLFDYRLMQLRDLSPDSPNVAGPPYNGLPPPHLLIGYQYMHKTLNNYIFDNRVFMQLAYDRSTGQSPSRLYWTCLADCSYSLNVGQYMRFLDLQNFHHTFSQMHNAVLMDRVTADMARVHLSGRGIDVGDRGQVLSDAHGYLSGSGAADLQRDVVMRVASRDDADLLQAIRELRVALCHFMFCYLYDHFTTDKTYRFLPGSEVYGMENWLTLFIDAFSNLDTGELVESVSRDPLRLLEEDEPADTMARCLVSTLAADASAYEGLVGGAIQLRNRRVTSRSGLRSRDERGRAITASQMRKYRRRTVKRFVDRLPVSRRRRRLPEEPEPEPMDVDDVWDEEPGPSRGRRSEDMLFNEVLQTVMEAIEALREELGPRAKKHELFQFSSRFYELLLTARQHNMATASFLRKWVLYFFLAEHIASTLYYMYSHFITYREFRRYCDVQTLQILITGWDTNAQQIFKRIWSEQTNPALIFETLWERVLRDFLLMVEKTDQFVDMDDADQQIFLSDIQYRDKSGDVDEVLKQLNLSEELLDSVDISFRIKVKGIVGITTSRTIRDNLRRVLRHRQEDLDADRAQAERGDQS